jgi:hypothetical protein
MTCQDAHCPFAPVVHAHRPRRVRTVVGGSWPLPAEEQIRFGLPDKDAERLARDVEQGENPLVEYQIDPSRLEKLSWS